MGCGVRSLRKTLTYEPKLELDKWQTASLPFSTIELAQPIHFRPIQGNHIASV